MNLLKSVANKLFTELELHDGEFYYGSNKVMDKILGEIDSSFSPKDRIQIIDFDYDFNASSIKNNIATLVLVGTAHYERYCGQEEGDEFFFPASSYKFRCPVEVLIEVEEDELIEVNTSQIRVLTIALEPIELTDE